jgi:hypothetical protein
LLSLPVSGPPTTSAAGQAAAVRERAHDRVEGPDLVGEAGSDRISTKQHALRPWASLFRDLISSRAAHGWNNETLKVEHSGPDGPLRAEPSYVVDGRSLSREQRAAVREFLLERLAANGDEQVD